MSSRETPAPLERLQSPEPEPGVSAVTGLGRVPRTERRQICLPFWSLSKALGVVTSSSRNHLWLWMQPFGTKLQGALSQLQLGLAVSHREIVRITEGLLWGTSVLRPVIQPM